MQGLVVSMLRFSAAVALYGIEQIQTTLDVTQSGQDFFKILDKFEGALDSLTETLVDNLDKGKRDTLKSFTEVAEGLVSRSFDGMTMIDPREMLRATNDLIQRSSGAFTDWVSRAASADGEKPKPAAEVLQ